MGVHDVRMTLQTLAILRVMLEDPEAEWYGLQISRAAGLKSGTIYPALARLQGAGWVERHAERIDPSVEGRPPRALYRFTDGGARAAREAVTAHVARFALPPRPTRHGRRRPKLA
jgi:DNA-binding PadR family transcriptional regulator